jgi:uncharacterized protein YjbI with pentapeptide repeats
MSMHHLHDEVADSLLKLQLHAGQDLTTTQFVKGSLRRVKFDGANLSGTSMFGSFCKGCSFKAANLVYASPSRFFFGQ